MNISIVKLHPEAIAPSRATPLSAGLDLCATRDGSIAPASADLVKTGVAIRFPAGHFGMVCPRSGLALKHGVTVLNAPGIIDEDYRGEIGVILCNMSRHEFHYKAGDRIAQLIVAKAMYPGVNEIPLDMLDATERGDGGFGSTGV